MDEHPYSCESPGTANDGGTMSHKDLSVFEPGNTKPQLEVSNCNMFNAGISTDSHQQVHSNSATDFLLRSVHESADKSRSSQSETGSAEKCEQNSTAAKEITPNEQRKRKRSCDSHNQQCDGCCQLHIHEQSQGNSAFVVRTAETDAGIDRKDKPIDNEISDMSVLPNQRSILFTENSLEASADSSPSVQTPNDENYSFLSPNSHVDDSCNGRSLQYIQPQTVDNNIYGNGISLQHSLSDFVQETSSRLSSDFQPIILDVRGGYCEMESEDGGQGRSFASLEASESNAGQSTPDVTEHITSIPNSAFQLLQGMALCAVSSSTKTPEAKGDKTAIDVCAPENEIAHSISPPIVSQVNTNCTFRRSGDSLVRNVHSGTSLGLNTNTTLSLLRPKQPGNCPRSQPVSVNTIRSGIVAQKAGEAQPTKPSKALSNYIVPNAKGTTSFSCVFVQDKDNSKKGQMAFLIPQSSLPKLSNISSSPLCDLSTTPVTLGQTSVKNIHNGQICSPSSSQDCLPSKYNPVMERITKLVTNTLNSFCVQGKDLKHSNLLKVMAPKRNGDSQYPVSCSVCSEGYYDEEGLNFHLERTVFHLTYYCSFCKRNIVFFNKCSLWTHLKNEAEKPILNYTNISCLKPYEFDADDDLENEKSKSDDMDSTPEELLGTTCSTNVPNDVNEPATTVAIEAVAAKNSVDQLTVSEVPSSSSIEQTCSLPKCSVCLLNFPNLIAHLCPTTQVNYLCTSCGMFLPSICAQEAHMKIHSGVVKGMSCPECGQSDFNTAQDSDDLRSVFDHVDSCRHFNRMLDLKCFCSQQVTNVNQLLKHFTDKHCRTLFKCPFCVLAFTQNAHLVGHLDKVHKLEGASVKASVLCLFCQQIIKSVEELKDHVDQHVEQFKNNSVFRWKCFICSKSYVDKVDLNNHLESDHAQKYKRCTICYSLFWSRKNLVEHIVQKKCLRLLAQKLNICVDHQSEVPEQEVENVHLSKLFEAKKVVQNVAGKQRQLATVPLSKTKTHLVNIAPKPASSQLVANKQSNQSNQKLPPSDPPAQAHPEISISANKVSTQPRKLIITSSSNSTGPGNRNSAVTCVNQCVVCRKIIDREKLSDHLQSHQRQGIIICYVCQRRDFTTMEEAIAHSNTCFREDSESGENHRGLEPNSSSATDVVLEANTDGREVNVEPNMQSEMQVEKVNTDSQSVFPCLLCGLAFQSLSAREKHVSRSHDGTRIVYHCGICSKRGKTSIFTKKELTARHITKKHRIVNRDSVNRLIRTEEQNVSSGLKFPASEPAPEETDSVSPPKRLRVAGEGDYMCGKCGFSCCHSEEFSQHITSHNSAQEPQCPECGLCFTILHALKKHLLAVHKIKEVDDYLKVKNITEHELEEEDLDILPHIHRFGKPQPEPTYANSDKSRTSNAKRSSNNPLECTVCYKAFDNEANLKTHMRNHGMAFIRSKRYKTVTK